MKIVIKFTVIYFLLNVAGALAEDYLINRLQQVNSEGTDMVFILPNEFISIGDGASNCRMNDWASWQVNSPGNIAMMDSARQALVNGNSIVIRINNTRCSPSGHPLVTSLRIINP
jgi:hypothetical protein